MTKTAKDALRTAIEQYGGFLKVADKIGCTREFLYALCSVRQTKRPGVETAYRLTNLLNFDMSPFGAPIRRRKASRKSENVA